MSIAALKEAAQLAIKEPAWPFNEKSFRAKATPAAVAALIASHEQLVEVLRAGRVAIDVLMAQLIEVDPSFVPTQSAAWPALVAIKAALDVVEV